MVRIKQDFAALLAGRNLERFLSLRHRELMGDYLVPHPLYLFVAQHTDDAGPVDPARVNGAHDLEVLLRDRRVGVDAQEAVGIAQILLDVEDTIVTHDVNLRIEHLLFACEIGDLVWSDTVREIKHLGLLNCIQK